MLGTYLSTKESELPIPIPIPIFIPIYICYITIPIPIFIPIYMLYNHTHTCTRTHILWILLQVTSCMMPLCTAMGGDMQPGLSMTSAHRGSMKTNK